VPGAAAPPDAGAEAGPDFVAAAAAREAGGMWRRSGDAEASRIRSLPI